MYRDAWFLHNKKGQSALFALNVWYTDEKEKKIFLIYKEIQNGAVAKSYMRKGFLIYKEMRKCLLILYLRRPLFIYDFAIAPFRISLYEENMIFFFTVWQENPIRKDLLWWKKIENSIGYILYNKLHETIWTQFVSV
jgi:hypothetical protein